MALAAAASAGTPNQRIVGGDIADPADWPFMAAVTSRQGNHFCGGSVVADDAVVTAAHCVVGATPESVHVITGRPNLDEDFVGEEIKLSDITVHQQYERKGYRDIAVLKLKHPTPASAVLLPTLAENEDLTAPGEELRVAGWGGTRRDGGNPSDILLDVALFTISDAECGTHFGFFRPTEEVCAFGAPDGDNYDDSCFGDSGGPLVADSPRGQLLVGIVSYGGPRCGIEKPGVYQQVSRNLRFIKRKAGL